MAAAYESHEEEGEVSLMITKHCVRFSMSLCPRQAKGVIGVQGTVRAEPLTLVNGGDTAHAALRLQALRDARGRPHAQNVRCATPPARRPPRRIRFTAREPAP